MASTPHTDRELRPECARAHELEEQLLLDEAAIGDDELARLREHCESCPECAELRALLEALTDPPPLPPGTVEQVLDARDARARGRKRSIYLTFGLAAAAAALVLGIYVIAPSSTDEARSAEPGTALVAADGTRWVEGGSISTADEPLRLRRGQELTLALDRATRAQVEALRDQRLALNLESGQLAARVDPAASLAVAVETRIGRVLVKGTVFAVEIQGDEVRVAVVRGSVTVESPELEQGAAQVSANQSLAIRARQVTPLRSDRREAILALLGITAGAGAEEVAPVEIAISRPAEQPQPEPEVAAAPAKGSTKPPPVVEAPVAPEPPPPVAPEAQEPAAGSPSPGDLIRTARDLRLSGNWTGAAGAYRQVLSLHPERPEATTVLLPLAQIELTHLGRADLALVHFTQYSRRRPTGPLAEEAFHGRCSALRTLGRKQQEVAALEEFLQRFPGSVHAGNARARLQALGVEKSE